MGLLSTIQQSVVTRLQSDGYFANIPIFSEKIGDIQNQIDTALASLGICVIVMTVTARVEHPNEPGPYFSDIKVVVRVTENVLANQSPTGTQKAASDVIEAVCGMIHQYSADNKVCLTCAEDAIALVPDPSENLTYDAEFRTHGGIKYTPVPLTP